MDNMIVNNPLTGLSPLDGRYFDKTNVLRQYFSEFALIRYRVLVEIEYFIALTEIPLPQLADYDADRNNTLLRDIYAKFTLADAQRVKEIEKTTNHDVKAVEYFIRECFKTLKMEKYSEFIHFGLTSQDINNTAFPMMMRDAYNHDILPVIHNVIGKLEELANQWRNIPMLAHTHGQPASPTHLGKEIYVFVERLNLEVKKLSGKFEAKFGGATGNFNAHLAAYPNIDWIAFANNFVTEKLHLYRQQTTTQIEHYDALAEFCHAFSRINNILIDLCRDVWMYVSMEYFKQTVVKNEVGSSAMPHKVNPIDFENAEGNLGMANAVFNFLAGKLPISRLQRDLTDSTVIRNIGVPMGHCLVAYKSLIKGLNKIYANEEKLIGDLNANWAVVAEGIQTILRREGYENPYEALKQLTRKNEHITKHDIEQFIDNLNVADDIKEELKQITPTTYTGHNFRTNHETH